MKTQLSITLLGALLVVFLARAEDPKTTSNDPKKMDAPKVTKTDEEWRKKLTPEQYAVTRHAATEPSFGEAYEKFNAQGDGTYYCVCCGAELFTSGEKFHSGCGWPSFYDQSKAKNVAERVDNSHGRERIEVICKRCDAHLGHVFEKEGFATPTDRRFCINAAALNYVPKGGAAPKLEPVDSDKVKSAKEAVKKAAGE